MDTNSSASSTKGRNIFSIQSKKVLINVCIKSYTIK